MNERDVQQHVELLGWLYILFHSLYLVVGALIFLLLTGVGLLTTDVETRSVLVVVGPAVGLLLAVLALPGLAAGYGLLTRKPWARGLAIVVGMLGVVSFPLGTIIGLYACWVLFSDSAQKYLATHAPVLRERTATILGLEDQLNAGCIRPGGAADSCASGDDQ